MSPLTQSRAQSHAQSREVAAGYRAALARGTRSPSGAPGPAYWPQGTDPATDGRVDPEAQRVARAAGAWCGAHEDCGARRAGSASRAVRAVVSDDDDLDVPLRRALF